MTEMIFKSQISLMDLMNQNYSPPAILQTMENPKILDPHGINCVFSDTWHSILDDYVISPL